MTASVVLPISLEPAPLDDAGAALLAREVGVAGGSSQLAEAIPPAATALRERGLRVLGRFGSAGRDDVATLSIAVQELRAPDSPDDLLPDRGVDALRDSTAGRRPYADTRRVELPCGSAVASLVFGRFDLPDADVAVPTFRAEFLVPTPAWDGIVVLDVSTTDEAAWPEISQEAVRIARSLRFLDDGEPAREGEHLLRL